MKKFNHVIVRRPCKAMVEGITSGLYPGKPDYALALKEHDPTSKRSSSVMWM